MASTPHRPIPARRSAARHATLAMLLAATVAACQGTDAGATDDVDAADADVVVVADDMRFVDPPATLEEGEQVVVLHNRDRAPHDLTVDGPLATFAAADGGGQTAEVATFEPGTYTIYCAVGGHRDAGMEFDVEVG